MTNQTQSQWISVEEKLPPIHEKVLVYFFCKNGACDIGLLPTDIKEIRIGSLNDTTDWYVYDHGSFNAHYVTHWQPLPEPPR